MMQLDHIEYQKKVKKMTDESLKFIIADCKDALLVNPGGEKAGWYQDEILYCDMELARREKRVKS